MINIANRVRTLVANECQLDSASLGFVDDLTQDHGIDDLDLMKIAMRLEEVFGIEVSDEAFQQDRTVAKCVDLVCGGLAPAASHPCWPRSSASPVPDNGCDASSGE